MCASERSGRVRGNVPPRVPERWELISYWRRGKTKNRKLKTRRAVVGGGRPSLGNAFGDGHADRAVGLLFRPDGGRCGRLRRRRRLLGAAGVGRSRGRVSVGVQVDVLPVTAVLFRFLFRFPVPPFLAVFGGVGQSDRQPGHLFGGRLRHRRVVVPDEVVAHGGQQLVLERHR